MKKLTFILFLFITSILYSQECELYVPNAFTPDQDGLNEYWQVSLPDTCYLEYSCRLYNRIGQVIWRSTDPKDKWLGNFKNSGYFTQNEQYLYLITYRNRAESRQVIGTVTIIR